METSESPAHVDEESLSLCRIVTPGVVHAHLEVLAEVHVKLTGHCAPCARKLLAQPHVERVPEWRRLRGHATGSETGAGSDENREATSLFSHYRRDRTFGLPGSLDVLRTPPGRF